jgi:hypothetical protein
MTILIRIGSSRAGITRAIGLKAYAMCLIISVANSLHLTFFAPSISRWKS